MALGFFDGVHFGHQRLIQTASKIAKEKKMKLAVMTFYPHPREIIQDVDEVKYLTPLTVKQKRLEGMGVEKLFIVKFDFAFSQLAPQEFINQYIRMLNCKHVVAGFDFTYGYKGTGNMSDLKENASGEFAITIIPKVERNGYKISSTLIRNLISAGSVDMVPKYLGAFYEMRGEIHQQINRDQDDSYYHIEIDAKYIIPDPGTYRIVVEMEKKLYQGICLDIVSSKQRNTLIVQLNHLEVKKQTTVRVKWLKKINVNHGYKKEIKELLI